MDEPSVASSDLLEAEWARMRRAVHLANVVSSTDEQTGAFRTAFTKAARETIDRCRAERKRVRDAETPRDTSDAAVVRAAHFTDALPLADYDGILHLVPRLVNIVTVKCFFSNLKQQTRENSCSFHVRSSPRPFPFRGRGSSCRSTFTPSARAAPTPIMLRGARGGAARVQRAALPRPRVSRGKARGNR